MRSPAVEDYNVVDTSMHHEYVFKGTVLVQAYAKVFDRMKSEAVLAALNGRTWEAATHEEVEFVEPQIELPGDDPNLKRVTKRTLSVHQRGFRLDRPSSCCPGLGIQ